MLPGESKPFPHRTNQEANPHRFPFPFLKIPEPIPMKTPVLHAIGVSVCLLAQFAVSQSSRAPAALPAVDFLTTKPVIDGRIDNALVSLPVRLFDTVETTSDMVHVSRTSYRLGYTNEGLYLYLETSKKELMSRDRAYQNGDGFHMVLAIPTADGSPTREFLVLAFSPRDPSPGRRAFVWYRNVDLAFIRLQNVQIAESTHDGRSGIELFLPWNSIPPYHPWLRDAIGFNLCFVEASGEKDMAYHFVLLDERIQSEQYARQYRLLPFAPPPPDAGAQISVCLEANHLFPSDTIRAVVAGVVGNAKSVHVRFDILNEDSVTQSSQSVLATLVRPPRHAVVSLPKVAPAPGAYTVRWSCADPPASGEAPLTVLPAFNLRDWTARVSRLHGVIAPGSETTILFLLEQISNDLAALRAYDTGRGLFSRIVALDSLLVQAERGSDAIANRSGVLRRAYRSTVDSSLQPYTIKIPKSYSPSHPIPLVVYLHGSGQDDQGSFDDDSTDDGFIHLAPRGRGTSNVYTKDHAQDDIREAIDDVCRNYSIDTTRIILTGFSMGGYGVYRTFIEMPTRFCALAIFSGSPNMATKWLGPGYPDFSTLESVQSFRGMKMFIFHGGRDRNVPVEYTDSLVVNLRKAGATVEYVREEEKGHENPSEEGQLQYRKWLDRVTDR